MEGFCLKCSKDIADKRKGTLYCSESCRGTTWQKAKRVRAKQAEPVQMDEEELDKLIKRGTFLLQNFHVQQVMGWAIQEDKFSELIKSRDMLAEWCRMMSNHPILRIRKEK